MKKQKEILKKISWQEFRISGLLWFTNRFLHLFGIALVLELKKNGKIKEVYPAKCKFRGFDYKCEERGFKRLTRYMNKNIKRWLKEIKF